MSGLFEGPPPRVCAIPASASFLDVFADRMVAALANPGDPFALSDALILLPNRRAARGLIDAFAARLGGAALLPTIRPLGDLSDEPQVWGADPIALDVSPAIEPTLQRLELASLIRARDKAQGGTDDPARALALADELIALLDSAAAAGDVRWNELPHLVTRAELALHWEASAKFLEIITTYWPQRLSAEGLMDPGARRSALLRALAQDWRINPPQRPIVIAGSTGSVAATRELMHVVSQLPKGAVVFPGVDTDLDEGAWSLIGDQHPQSALKATLATLGLSRHDVRLLTAEAESGKARRVLMRETLTPAEKTADWLSRLADAGGRGFVEAGAQNLRLIEAATEDEEAASVALMLREVYETPSRTAALVTPDASLARRVEAKLARWAISPAVSHGLPLRETEAGALVVLLCELSRDSAEPVALSALLKHARVTIGADADSLARLEHAALRGPRRFETLGDLANLYALAKAPRAQALVRLLEQRFAPLHEVMAEPEATLARFADAVTQCAEALTDFDIWQEQDGEAAAGLLRDVAMHGAELGPMPPAAAARVLVRLMQGVEVPPSAGGDPRIAIWGPLEARLQRRDLMILGGLNEGVWPAPAPEDAFLSRPMRARIGLPSPDQRIGLAAHDFAQLANAPNVVLTRSLRRDGSPTIASRWLWRLQTLARGAAAPLARADKYLDWARVLDAPPILREAQPPRPTPPAGKRLTRISVTQVETLIRDPYAIYARRILGLEVLKPIGEPAGPAERGSAVHKAIERFGDGDDPRMLTRLLDEEFRRAGMSPERRAAERARLQVSIDALIEWFEQRRALQPLVYRERKGVLAIDGVELSGVADRIEIGPRHVAILDFKTGQPPSDSQVQSGLAPQLPLEAAMLARGVFENVPKAQADELIYWRFGNSDPTPRSVNLDDGAHDAGEKALSALRGLLARYAASEQPFLSKPRVQFIKPYADYDHLARRKEWADAEGDE